MAHQTPGRDGVADLELPIARRARLAGRAAEVDRPEGTVAALGHPPVDLVGSEQWRAAAGAVESYSARWSHVSHSRQTDAVTGRPSRGVPVRIRALLRHWCRPASRPTESTCSMAPYRDQRRGASLHPGSPVVLRELEGHELAPTRRPRGVSDRVAPLPVRPDPVDGGRAVSSRWEWCVNTGDTEQFAKLVVRDGGITGASAHRPHPCLGAATQTAPRSCGSQGSNLQQRRLQPVQRVHSASTERRSRSLRSNGRACWSGARRNTDTIDLGPERHLRALRSTGRSMQRSNTAAGEIR
jgi:hypothetical protein